jgi:hypothetical protein
VILANNGQDTINDFHRAEGDKIDLTALLSVANFGVLDSNGNETLDDGDAFVSISGGNTVIDLGAATGGAAGVNTVTVVGVTDLLTTDFVFA